MQRKCRTRASPSAPLLLALALLATGAPPLAEARVERLLRAQSLTQVDGGSNEQFERQEARTKQNSQRGHRRAALRSRKKVRELREYEEDLIRWEKELSQREARLAAHLKEALMQREMPTASSTQSFLDASPTMDEFE